MYHVLRHITFKKSKKIYIFEKFSLRTEINDIISLVRSHCSFNIKFEL